AAPQIEGQIAWCIQRWHILPGWSLYIQKCVSQLSLFLLSSLSAMSSLHLPIMAVTGLGHETTTTISNLGRGAPYHCPTATKAFGPAGPTWHQVYARVGEALPGEAIIEHATQLMTLC
ncbi:hypothetical protein AX17_001989, partial [Amanita inopinata Kibby_2008]